MPESRGEDRIDVVWDGFIAGALGAVTVALWFLVLDIVQGQPLHTPTVLGTALFHGPHAVAELHAGAAEPGTVMTYSGLHLALFALFGGVVAWMVREFRGRSGFGYLLLLAFVALGFGPYVFVLAFARPVIESVAAWSILTGNFLAALVMAIYFLLRRPDLLDRFRMGTSAEG